MKQGLVDEVGSYFPTIDTLVNSVHPEHFETETIFNYFFQYDFNKFS